MLAGYDREAVKQRLGVDVQADRVRKHLAACKPPPVSVENALFTSTFRKPLQCLFDLDRAQRAAQHFSLVKNDLRFDDARRELSRDDLNVVVERVPDIDRLARLVWQLASPPAPPPARASAALPPPADTPPVSKSNPRPKAKR